MFVVQLPVDLKPIAHAAGSLGGHCKGSHHLLLCLFDLISAFQVYPWLSSRLKIPEELSRSLPAQEWPSGTAITDDMGNIQNQVHLIWNSCLNRLLNNTRRSAVLSFETQPIDDPGGETSSKHRNRPKLCRPRIFGLLVSLQWSVWHPG